MATDIKRLLESGKVDKSLLRTTVGVTIYANDGADIQQLASNLATGNYMVGDGPVLYDLINAKNGKKIRTSVPYACVLAIPALFKDVRCIVSTATDIINENSTSKKITP